MGRLAQTLAISVEKSVAHQLCRSNYTPADTAVRFVSKMQNRFCALVNQFQTSRNVRHPLGGRALNHQNIACTARTLSILSRNRKGALCCAGYNLSLRVAERSGKLLHAKYTRLAVVQIPLVLRQQMQCTFPFRHCWLTHRSTGPIAAGRHLGYKSLAQIPARRNGPVSSNVRPHKKTMRGAHYEKL